MVCIVLANKRDNEKFCCVKLKKKDIVKLNYYLCNIY